MKLSIPTFELPEWDPERDFQLIRRALTKISRLGKNAGACSDRFKLACRKIRQAFESSDFIDYEALISEAIDVRAFTYLLATDEQFADEVSMERSLLSQLVAPRSPMSRLSLTQLVSAFFKYFDKLAKGDELEHWCLFLRSQLAAIDSAKGGSELKIHARNAEIIFTPSGPSRLTKNARIRSVDLDVIIGEFALDGFAGGRYLTLARYFYYLQTLQEIDVGQDHKILAEVCKRDVVTAPYEDGKLLGHAILEILIDRSAGKQISDSWQNTILTIAGDPRVPHSSDNYQKWWTILGDKRIALMRGWLSRFDLQLFLKVLEQSAKDGKHEDMERMFKPRKVFMEGLEEAGLISGSRLFLSKYAERYLRRHYKKEELPNYALVTSLNTSMIYLNIDNKMHMIEGSHSFTLKLMDKLPSKCRANDYSTKVISNDELRTMVGDQYRREYGDNGIAELRHDQHLNWQAHAVEFLKRHRVKINAAQVIEKEQYRLYKQKFGAG